MSYMKGKFKILGGEINMKGKFRILGNIGLALFVACALMLAAVPMQQAAADVSSATVAVDDSAAGHGAKYTITFTLGKALTTSSNSMYFRFPSDTVITAGGGDYTKEYIEVSVNGATAENPGADATVTSNEILVDMANTWSAAASSSIGVVFKENSTTDYIKNPTAAGDYKLRVHTTVETTPVLSAAYTITGGPTKIIATPADTSGDPYLVAAKATVSPKITIELQNASSEPTAVTSATNILLSSSGTNGEFSVSATSWSAVTQVTIAAGSSEASFYYKQPDTADDVTFTFSEWPSAGWTDETMECDVTAATLNVDIFDALGVYTGVHDTGVTAIALAYADAKTVDKGTLKVRPGVYTSALVFNSEYITLESYDGADTTFINVSGGGKVIHIETSGTAAKPFKLGGDSATSGFTIMGNGANPTDVYFSQTEARNYITIQNNKILAGAYTGHHEGIVSGHGCDYVTIKDNTIEVGTKMTGIYQETKGSCNHIKIEDNTFETVSDVDGGGVGIFLCQGALDVSGTGEYFYIRGNTFNKAGCAIEIETSFGLTGGTSSLDNFVISQNTITNCTGVFGSTATGLDGFTDADAAIALHNAWSDSTTTYGDITYVLIEKNIITGTSGTGTSGYGVNIIEGDPDTDNITGPITIRYNNIYDNAGNGVYSNEYQEAKADVATVANMNWWGAAGGPNATGGDGVTTASGGYYYVTCANWATQDIVTNLNAGIGLKKTLTKGWNIVSVPLPMDSTANTVAEQVSLGHLAYFSVGYTYASGAWSAVTNDTVLTPCEAYYIKVTATDYLGAITSSDRGVPPTKTLAAGWNLMSLAYLYPTDPAFTTTSAYGKEFSIALRSVGDSVSVAVSPSYNSAAWSDVYDATDPGSSNYFYPGEGYWVYMSASGTLAGFSSTPFFSVTWTTY